jgi:hypothetical protein
LLVAALVFMVPAAYVVSNQWRTVDGPPLDQPGMQAEMDAVKSITPLPPAVTWPPKMGIVSTLECSPGSEMLQCSDDGQPVHVLYDKGWGIENVQDFALCSWVREWQLARSSGDAGRVAAAVRILDQARGWQTFADKRFGGEWGPVFAAVDRGDLATVLSWTEPLCVGGQGSQPTAALP